MSTALTVPQVAALFGCSDQTIYRLIKEKRIPYFIVRGSIRIDPQALADWLEKRQVICN
jgi:excisionase family DNA binding protein